MLLCSLSVFAEENPGSQVRHVGIQTYLKIGTPKNPVTANEYCAFLNSEEPAKYLDDALDDSFMNCVFANREPGSSYFYHYPVQQNDCITRLNKYTYRYVVIPGRGNYIIDGISYSWCWIPFVRKNFHVWRENPMVQEISDYLNDKIEGLDNNAEIIKNKYAQNIHTASIFHLLDITAEVARNNHSMCESLQLIDEENRPLINLFMENDDVSLQESRIQAVVVAGMEYYRPRLLKYSTI